MRQIDIKSDLRYKFEESRLRLIVLAFVFVFPNLGLCAVGRVLVAMGLCFCLFKSGPPPGKTFGLPTCLLALAPHSILSATTLADPFTGEKEVNTYSFYSFFG